MVSEQEWHKVGDHRLVNIPTAGTSVTFNIASDGLTSSSDTETNKYFDNLSRGAIQFGVVADKDIQVTAINGTNFTEAIPVNGNANYQEDKGLFNSVTVKTTADNTTISMRCR